MLTYTTILDYNKSRGPCKKMIGLLPIQSRQPVEWDRADWEVLLPCKVKSQTNDVPWLCSCLSGAPFLWNIKTKILNPRFVIRVHVEGWQLCVRVRTCVFLPYNSCVSLINNRTPSAAHFQNIWERVWVSNDASGPASPAKHTHRIIVQCGGRHDQDGSWLIGQKHSICSLSGIPYRC